MFASLDAPNSKAIVAQLLRLSQEPQNQPIVAQEKGCLAGLVDYLRHSDNEVVLMAARTLEFLSSHPQNKKLMKEFPQLLDVLNDTYSSRAVGTDNISVRTKELTARCLGNLGVVVKEQRNDSWWGAPLWAEEDEDNVNDENDNVDNENTVPTHNNIQLPHKKRANNKYYTLTLRIDGLEENATAVVTQRVLIHVKGVISVNLDRVKGLAVVGTRGTGDGTLLETLQEVLSNAGISGTPWPATLPPAVASNNNNNNNANAGNAQSSDSSFSSGGDDSGYLNESQYADTSNEGFTIAKWGASSLEARMAEQKREEELKAAKTEKLLSKVTSLVSNASSWLMGW